MEGNAYQLFIRTPREMQVNQGNKTLIRGGSLREGNRHWETSSELLMTHLMDNTLTQCIHIRYHPINEAKEEKIRTGEVRMGQGQYDMEEEFALDRANQG